MRSITPTTMTMRTLATLTLLAAANPALAGTARSWGAAMQAVPVVSGASSLPPLGNTTIRQIMRLSIGGDSLRLTFDNSDSPNPLLIDHIEVAQVDAAGRIVPNTSQRVTVGDRPAVVIPAHAPMVSDPVKMTVAPLGKVAISIHLAAGQQPWAFHGYAAANTLLAPGDQTTAPEMTGTNAMQRRFLVSGIDVTATRPLRSVVAYGDSITDGVRATVDSDRRWPDQLAGRLQQAGMTQVGVTNQGISANKVLQDGVGISALARFDRDVLGVPGVSHVIVLEGVNDIGGASRDNQQASFDTVGLINAYRQMVVRAHDHGVKVLLATILPYKGAGYWSAWGEEQRAKVNAWIRSQREADGVVDFDAAVRNPADPQAFAPAYDSGDHLHPNDVGFTAMAKAVPLNLLK